MDNIGDLLKARLVKKSKTNKTYLIAEEVAGLTNTPVKRWLRPAKDHEWALRRSIDELKDIDQDGHIKNRASYFTWLYNKYKGEKNV